MSMRRSYAGDAYLQVNLDVRKHIPQMGCLNRPGYGSLGINLIAKIFILGEILLKGRFLTFRHRPGEIFINSVISFYVRHHFSYNFLNLSTNALSFRMHLNF